MSDTENEHLSPLNPNTLLFEQQEDFIETQYNQVLESQ